MRKLGAWVFTAALATTTAWAQTSDQSTARKQGNEGARGVVTGRSADGGIALKTDAAKSNAGVPTVSGGVGLNARDNLRSQAPEHNVKLVFSLNTGNYVSDVQVKVTDASGRTLIDDVSNGPWLMAKLPPGNYTATAVYNGKPVTQKLSVAKSGVRTANFRWPASAEQAVGAADSEGSGQILGTGPQEPQPR